MNILKRFKDLLVARTLLAKAGAIVTVDNHTEGKELIALNIEEISVYQELEQKFVELKQSHAALKEAQANFNTKALVYEGRTQLWWENLSENHPEIAEAIKSKGAHIDPNNMVIREGALSKEARNKVITEIK